MAKSLRSKVKKRWRALKMNYLTQVAVKPQLEQLSKKLQATVIGVEYRQADKLNAFLDPNNPNAEFPQWAPKKMIDLRSTTIPGSGREYVGASRKNSSKTQTVSYEANTQMREEQQVEQEIKINRSLIKKDRKRNSKLRKTIVF